VSRDIGIMKMLPSIRPAFAELAKIVISGFIGWMMPRL
jgi:hypothetical protein